MVGFGCVECIVDSFFWLVGFYDYLSVLCFLVKVWKDFYLEGYYYYLKLWKKELLSKYK